ncbi:MAG: ferredoxin Fer [Halobacteriaceae archaeon]
MASPFDILQIDKDADEETIKQAYRERVKETHPDQGGSAEEFQTVQAAYTAITSEEWTKQSETSPDFEDDFLEYESEVEFLNYEVLDDFGWSIDDNNLFEKARDSDLDTQDYGEITVRPGETLLEAAERHGHTWPFACRGGACANCAIAVIEGEITQPVNHILPPEIIDENIRLSCNGIPITKSMKIIFNVKHLSYLDELRLPPYPFERSRARSGD